MKSKQPRKLRVNDCVPDLGASRLASREKSKAEKGAKQKSEEDFLKEIRQKKSCLASEIERSRLGQDYLETAERSLAKKLEALQREIQRKELAEGQEGRKEEGLKNELKVRGNVLNSQREIMGRLKTMLEQENRGLLETIEKYDSKIKSLETKNDAFFVELFELKTTLTGIERKKEEQEKKGCCCICLEKESTHACVPCGHKKYCENCIKNIIRCSICKGIIYKTIKVFD